MHAAWFLMSLLAIEAGAAEFKARPLAAATGQKAGFRLMPDTGVTFANSLALPAAEKNRILENGSGIALGDIDGDGLCDIYLCGLQRPNALYKNLGHWRFFELPNAGGASCAGQSSTGCAFADLDSDGDLDLLVNGVSAGTRFFRNDGSGNFSEDTGSGFGRSTGATSLAIADVEGDGDLDVFVVNYRSYTIRDGATPGFEARIENGKLVARPEEQFEVRETPSGPNLIEKGEPDVLYLNDGAGRFSAASWTDGRFLDEEGKPLTSAPRDWGLSAMFRDLNNDLAPDLYVCNDFIDSPDQIWINDGRGNFRLIDKLAIRHTSWSSMSVDATDINRDGFMDIFIADMLSPNNVRRQTQRSNAELAMMRHKIGAIDNRPQAFQNTLQLNRGDGTYAEIANLAGLQATDWTWSSAFLDVDLDGWDDLLVTTGNLHDIQDADTSNRIAPLLARPPHLRLPVLLQYPELRTPRRAYRNNGDLTFTEKSDDWGFNQAGIAHGMAFGDLDNDGDLDVVINNLNDLAGVYRNEATAPRIAVRSPAGTQIEINNQRHEITSAGRYLSCDDSSRVFAASSNSTINVRWRNGASAKFENIAPNQLLEFSTPSAPAQQSASSPPAVPAWFEEISFNYIHREEPFDDWSMQPFLPNRMSQFGPRAAATDFNGDGWPDLVIGASFFENDQRGGFKLAKTIPGEAVAIAGAGTNIAIALSNYELNRRESPVTFFPSLHKLPPQDAVVGAIALDQLLFVGAHSIPGRYPEIAPSRFFKGEELQRKVSEPIAYAGIVTGAQFADLDNDSDLDLFLSCDWSPPKIFRNDSGVFSDATSALGLSKFTGRWTSILVADFNGDKRPDLLVGNWGRNTRNQKYMARPLRLYYGDFNEVKNIEMFESFYDPVLQKYVPWRGKFGLARHMPFIDEKYPTFAAFGSAGTEEILAGKDIKFLEASTLETMLFLNRTNHFEPAPLPVEAQFAPVMSICAADFDNDGPLDLFLAENFFALHDEVTRLDAGRGMLLKGDGRGGFRAVSGQESGLKIYGEQRGCAAADFNRDGKMDLIVTQNAGPARLFMNRYSTKIIR